MRLGIYLLVCICLLLDGGLEVGVLLLLPLARGFGVVGVASFVYWNVRLAVDGL